MCALQRHWSRGTEKSGYDQHGSKRKQRVKYASLLRFPSAYCPVTTQVLLQLRLNHIFLWKTNSDSSWYWELMFSTPCRSCWYSHRDVYVLGWSGAGNSELCWIFFIFFLILAWKKGCCCLFCPCNWKHPMSVLEAQGLEQNGAGWWEVELSIGRQECE